MRLAPLSVADDALLRRAGFTPLPSGLWLDAAAGYALRPHLALERARGDAAPSPIVSWHEFVARETRAAEGTR